MFAFILLITIYNYQKNHKQICFQWMIENLSDCMDHYNLKV